QESLVRAGEIDQVVRVYDEWLQIVTGAETIHLVALRLAEFIRRPAARAGRENLERVASQAVSPFSGILHTSSCRGVNANTTGSQAGRALRSRMLEDVLFLRHGAGHSRSIDGSPGCRVGMLHLRCIPPDGTLNGAASPAAARSNSLDGQPLRLCAGQAWRLFPCTSSMVNLWWSS